MAYTRTLAAAMLVANVQSTILLNPPRALALIDIVLLAPLVCL